MVNKIRMFLAGLIACFFITSCGSDYDDVSVLNDDPSLSTDTLKTRSFEDGIDMILLSWRKIPSFEVNFDNNHRITSAVFVLAQIENPDNIDELEDCAYEYLHDTEALDAFWPIDARINLYNLWSNNAGCPNYNFYLPNELKIYSYISNRFIRVGDIHSEVLWHTPYYLMMSMYREDCRQAHAVFAIRGCELGGGADVKLFELDEDAKPLFNYGYNGNLKMWNEYIGYVI